MNKLTKVVTPQNMKYLYYPGICHGVIQIYRNKTLQKSEYARTKQKLSWF